MNIYTQIVSFVQSGGTFMYPIALVLVIGLLIAMERWIFLSKAKLQNKAMMNRIIPLLAKKDLTGIRNLTQESKAPIARIVAAGMRRLSISTRRDDVEYAMEEGIMEYVPRLEKRTPYLATLGNTATLLGLLGTIIGLIAAFTAVASADPSEKASLLSASISVAMNTTAFGLIAAIPMLLLHSVLQSKTTEIVDSLEMAGVKVLNMLSEIKALAHQSREKEKAVAHLSRAMDKVA